MPRTARFKIIYLVQLLALGGAAAAMLFVTPERRRGAVVILLAVLLFLPGRIQGVMLRGHFRGRRLADQGRFEESIRESEAFLAIVEREPWRKRAIWLGGAAYSRDVEAMTLNNVGIAALHLGELEKASRSFERAIALDPEYPVPQFNLAVLASVRGNEQEARHRFANAVRLGYRVTTADAVIRQGQQVLAAWEGRRLSASAPDDSER